MVELQKVSEPGSQVPKKFSALSENLSIKVFSHKAKMIFHILCEKEKIVFDSSILLIMILGKMDGLTNINMSKSKDS